MAIQFCDGFEQYANENDIHRFWTGSVAAKAITVETDTPFGRGKSIRFGQHSTTHNGLQIPLPRPTNTIGFAFHMKVEEFPTFSYDRGLIEFWAINGSNAHCNLSLNSDNTLYFGALSTTDSSGTYFYLNTPPVPVGEWVHVEIKVVTATSGSVEIRVNGNVVGNLTGIDTYHSGQQQVDFIRLCRQAFSGSSSAGKVLIDNFVCWDTTGGYNNDFLGDVEVATLFPTADGATMDWTPSEGTDGYAMVDDEAPDDDATYIASGTPDAVAQFELGDLHAGNMRILAVQPFAVARKDDSGARSLQLGVVSDQAAAEAAPINLGVSYAMMSAVFEVDPETSLPWEKSAVDALQAQVKVL